jgi:hypothetical protein
VDGSLILTGDFFDRGLRVTECLWLMYKLEGEALAAGGRVHFLLGNHEVMNLSGDHTYVRSKYVEGARLMEEVIQRLFRGRIRNSGSGFVQKTPLR